VDGIAPIGMGPDGVTLWRNPSDLMNNFYINISAIAFTNIQNELIGSVNSAEIKRLKRYEKEIENRKDIWKGNTIGVFEAKAD